MPDRRSANRGMFWRVIRRSVFANRGRLFVILLALGTGAAITAALLNLQVDAKRRVTSEFRSFGANVVIAPNVQDQEQKSRSTLDQSLYDEIAKKNGNDLIAKAELLYGIASVANGDAEASAAGVRQGASTVVAGYEYSGADLSDIFPSVVVAGASARPQILHVFRLPPVEKSGWQSSGEEAKRKPWKRIAGPAYCELGETLATRLGAAVGHEVDVWTGSRGLSCSVTGIRKFGGSEDSQVFLSLHDAQMLFGLPGRASLILVNVPGGPNDISPFISHWQTALPLVDVRGVRQFTEGEARLYGKISGILTATVAVVLVLTALCVMAAMTNVAMERKNDVGLMKAIGGSVRRVLRLFLAEAALLGLAGGLIGAAIGIVASVALGKAVFGVAAQPRLIVYPISVALTISVAILAAYPLRRLVHIRPASVFRGEE